MFDGEVEVEAGRLYFRDKRKDNIGETLTIIVSKSQISTLLPITRKK
jgi:hypothetical protein